MQDKKVMQDKLAELKREFLGNDSHDLTETQLTALLLDSVGVNNAYEVAKGLLQRYDSLSNMVLRGIYEERDEKVKLIFSLLHDIQHHIKRPTVFTERLSTIADITDYCQRLLCNSRTEEMYAVFLSRDNIAVGSRHFCTEEYDNIGINIGQLLRSVVAHSADKVFLAHSHPFGPLAPSQEDVDFTDKLNALLRSMGILLVEHLIVTTDGAFSFYNAGMLTHRPNAKE